MNKKSDHKNTGISLEELAAEIFREYPELYEKYEKKYGPWPRPLSNSANTQIRAEPLKHSTPS